MEDKQQIGIEQGIVFVGDKPTKVYLLPAITHLSQRNRVSIKARGKAIVKAVKVALGLIKAGGKIGSINISETELPSSADPSKIVRVAEIEIEVVK